MSEAEELNWDTIMDDVTSEVYDEAEPTTEETLELEGAEDTSDTSNEEDFDLEEGQDEDLAEENAEGVEPDNNEAINAPASLSAEDREAFYQLPPEQQKWLSDRVTQMESDYTKKTVDLSQQRKSIERLESVLEPRRNQFAMQGMDDSTAVGQLFAISDFANSDPIGFVKYFFENRGIPLSALTEDAGQTASVDPQMAAIQQQLSQLQNNAQQQQYAAQEAELGRFQAEIDKFATDQANPFYAELESQMVPFVQALRQSNPDMPAQEVLKQAYNSALANNSEVKAKAEADAKAKAEAAKVKSAKAAAAKAKRASGSSSVRSSATVKGGKDMSLDDALNAAWDEFS